MSTLNTNNRPKMEKKTLFISRFVNGFKLKNLEVKFEKEYYDGKWTTGTNYTYAPYSVSVEFLAQIHIFDGLDDLEVPSFW